MERHTQIKYLTRDSALALGLGDIGRDTETTRYTLAVYRNGDSFSGEVEVSGLVNGRKVIGEHDSYWQFIEHQKPVLEKLFPPRITI